jgi:hypothetical protein
MGKEIKVDVNLGHTRSFKRAVENNPKIDFRTFNPHLAVRCRIADELDRSGSAQVSANVNGGPLEVHVNGSKIEEGGEFSRRGLVSVINVYSNGRGEEIADLMLKGTILVLRSS